jgi:iron(III) transport system substrate-binding protein
MEDAMEKLHWLGTGLLRSALLSLAVGGIVLLQFATEALGQEAKTTEKLLAAARKEGKVVIYGASSFRPMVKGMEAMFTKKYGIKIEYLIVPSREIRDRIGREVRMQKPVADLAQAGATSLPAVWQDGALESWLPPAVSSIRPEIIESMDLPNMPITPLYANFRGILINTRLVAAGEEPTFWKDLSEPRWRGKILMDDPRSPGAGNSMFVSTIRHPALGKEFHEKIVLNKPVYVGSGTYQQIATRVAQGEFAVGFPVDAEAMEVLKGAPVKWIAPKEGVTYTVMGIGLVKNAARPNAAKLFIDYLLSDEFQLFIGNSAAPVKKGVKSTRQEWSLDHASLLPRPLAETREERESFYRLIESIYGIR